MESKISKFGSKDNFLIGELKNEFINTFNSIDHSKNRFEVFQDFITCFACSLRNSLGKISPSLFNRDIENEYFKIMAKYPQKDFLKFPHMISSVVCLLEAYNAPHDVLGDFYMSLDFGSKHSAQFFTPSEISYLMADMSGDKDEDIIKEKGFISIADPACGAGSTLLAKVKRIMSKGFNPLHHVYVEGTDIDRLVGMMCFIQMSLWNVPAKIYIGDSLTQRLSDVWVTPAFYFGNWRLKLNK